MLTCFFSQSADAHKLSAKVKGELPGRASEAEKRTEQYGAEAGAKFDSAVSHSIMPLPWSALSRPHAMDNTMGSSRLIANLSQQVHKSQAEFAKAKAEAEAYAKDVKANTLKKVDEFDRKVEAKTAEAKTGISSWFGGK